MENLSFLKQDDVFPALKATSRKQLFQVLSETAVKKLSLNPELILDALQEREKLGSTGTGNGVAIPHAKLKELESVYGLFAKLTEPVDFEAVDGIPVDLVFLLLVPDDSSAEHLRTLSKISRLLKDAAICDKIRGCDTADGIYVLLTQPPVTSAA